MINNITLTGRVVKDIELRKDKQSNGEEYNYCFLKLAVQRTYSKENPITDFISCKAFRRNAEVLAQYAKQGSLIAIVGSLITWRTDKMINGEKVFENNYCIEIKSMTLLTSKDSSDSLNTSNGESTKDKKPQEYHLKELDDLEL